MPSTVYATTMFVCYSALLILLERVIVGRWNPAWNLRHLRAWPEEMAMQANAMSDHD
jgi:hypothetical protein